MSQPKVFRTPEDWHAWYALQAEWTQPTRTWLYRQTRLGRARDVIEVGCGTGVITGEIVRLTRARVFGLDIDPGRLSVARREEGGPAYVQGDAHALPFVDGSFDVAVCHYLLLWVREPATVVREMARVVRAGGAVLACAEPDYGGRLDHPPELVGIGRLQAEGLRRQGADPEVGRRLSELFCAAGLQVHFGLMAGGWQAPGEPDEAFAAEWAMRRQDLANLLPAEELDRLEQLDRQALQAGRRLLFVPTFYALGKKEPGL
jgi:SAM-dependent methyltransferase